MADLVPEYNIIFFRIYVYINIFLNIYVWFNK